MYRLFCLHFCICKCTNNILNNNEISNIFTLIDEIINYYIDKNTNSLTNTRDTHI
nr:MAG TPA: hypothetical protein [Caudoviricetes sp.]